MGDVLDDLYNGQTPSRFRDDYWNGEISWLSSGELNRGIVNFSLEKITKEGKESANLRVVPKGTFVMSITGLEAVGTRGNCAILGFDTTINQSCMALYPKKDKLTSEFLFQWYRMVGEHYGVRFTQGTKQQSYNAEIIKDLNICLPKIDEQNKITTFLKKIDNLITLHHRKLENLKKQKKGLLQKMFPEKGKKVPEIRFPEFTNDWEQRKLGELSKSFEYGLNASAKEFDGENKYIRITDIDEESHNFMTDDLTSPNINLSNAGNYKLSRGDILFARTGASVGKSYIYKESDGIVYYAGFLIRARIKEEVNPEFVFQNTLTKDYEKYISVTSQRSGQPGVNAQEYAEYKIMVPNKEEQDKISDYMRKFDNLISLHQRKLEHLQKQKKALLQQMFV